MDDKIVPPLRNEPHYEKGYPTLRVSNFHNDISEAINNGKLAGSGSPEGVIDAAKLTFYLDEDTNTLYIKKTARGSNTGWVTV